MVFLQLDAGSEWTLFLTPPVLMRAGKLSAARDSVKKMKNRLPHWGPHWRFLEACLEPEQQGLNQVAHENEAQALTDPDPENRYFEGSLMAFCGTQDSAVRLIRSAIQGNYCAYSALQSDPLLTKLRLRPEFQEFLSAARECQQKVLAQHN